MVQRIIILGFLIYQLVITFCVLIPAKLLKLDLPIIIAMRILRVVKLSRLIHCQAVSGEYPILMFNLLYS
jgi:hypothetical protein